MWRNHVISGDILFKATSRVKQLTTETEKTADLDAFQLFRNFRGLLSTLAILDLGY